MAHRKKKRLSNIQRKPIRLTKHQIVELHIDELKQFGDSDWNCVCGDFMKWSITHDESDGSANAWYACDSCQSKMKVFMPSGYDTNKLDFMV